MELDRFEQQFCYMDGFYQVSKDKASKWIRIKSDEIDEKLREPAKNYNVFTTIQKFSEAFHREDELQLSDFYFDFDGKFSECISEVIRLISYLKKELDISLDNFRVYFSGSKGFHLLVNRQAFGIEPHQELTYLIREGALYLKELLLLSTLDPVVYSIRRMWRLPNSIHQKSGLFKVELQLSELKELTEKSIKRIAIKPREAQEKTPILSLKAKDWFDKFTENFQNKKVLEKLKPRRIINSVDLPVCMKFLENSQEVPTKGKGNQAALAMACYYRDTGVGFKEAEIKLLDWAKNQINISNKGNDRAIKASVRSVLKSVYHSDKYRFACNFIRAIGNKEKPIPCSSPNCKTADELSQQPEKPIQVHLSEASQAEYLNRMLDLHVIISGKDTSPFIVPSEVILKCSKKNRCRGCPCTRSGEDQYRIEFNVRNPELFEMMRISRKKLLEVILNKAGVGKCRRGRLSTIRSMNIEEVRLIPPANIIDDRGEYVVRKGFYIGHGIKTNKRYGIKALTMADPRTQQVVHAFEENNTQPESYSNIEFNEAKLEALKIFRPNKNQSVVEKIFEIHKDLECNVTRIWDRKRMAISIDLIYHTVTSFKFQGILIERGWAELIILGDSGQAKSTMMKALMNHYKYGESVTGESARRTGLVYSLSGEGGRWFLNWGIIPINDKGLVVIDEFSGMPSDQFAEMSGLRTSGIAEVKKIIAAETRARTRLIFMSNSKTGKPLSEYDYAVQALRGSDELVEKTEDIRRFDFGIGVKSGDVPSEKINRLRFPEITHKYNSYLCNLLISWVWSRKPEDIVFTQRATEKILVIANKFGEKYSASIPLVEPADERLKIARLSVAVAGRLFSTDEKMEKILVKEEHVDFVEKHLRICFNSLDYDSYSETERMVLGEIDKGDIPKIVREFKRFPRQEEFRNFLLVNRYFNRIDLEDQLGWEREMSKRAVRLLSSYNLIQKTTGGYRKRESFMDLLKEERQWRK